MKKTVLSILTLCMAMFFVAGCGDGKKGDSTLNPDTLVGTYAVDVFWVDAVVTQITNNCDEAKKFISDEDKAKGCGTGNVTATAKATISKDSDGNYVAISKMQMADGPFSDPSMSSLQETLQASQYNYTVYSPMSASSVSGVTINVGDNAVKGTTGRDAVNVVNDGDATYTFQVMDDGRILNKMTKSLPMPLNVYVLLRKTGDTAETLDANVKFDAPTIPKFNETPVTPQP